MGDRLRSVLQHLLVATGRAPVRGLWRALYEAVGRTVATWIAGSSGAAVYLSGSMADGEPVYGRSDIDLVAVASNRIAREYVERRVIQMHRALPLLRRLVGHAWVYESAELQAAASAPYPIYGLEDQRPAFYGAEAPADPMGLLARPGLRPPAASWRRVRGGGSAAAPALRSGDNLLGAWLELQYRSRWALLATAMRRADRSYQLANALAGAAQAWLQVAGGETAPGNRSALRRTAALIEEERDGLLMAVASLESGGWREGRRADVIWASFVQLCGRVGELIALRSANLGSIDVRLEGRPHGSRKLPLLDWPGLALPSVDWSDPARPVLVEDCFEVIPGDPRDMSAAEKAARDAGKGDWKTLRDGPFMLRPNLDVWVGGRLRGIETPSSDPVSFALDDGRPIATFPNIDGWSAVDRARRAVAEHRGWLFTRRVPGPSGRSWAPARPAIDWPTPATIALLLSAARAALFLQSVDEGSPCLALSWRATVVAWAARDPFAGEAADEAMRALDSRNGGEGKVSWEVLIALLDSVHRMPPYCLPAGHRAPVASVSRLRSA
jgi:hypothetical protein